MIIPEIIPVLTNTAISGLAFVLIGWFHATHFTSLRCYFHLYYDAITNTCLRVTLIISMSSSTSSYNEYRHDRDFTKY